MSKWTVGVKVWPYKEGDQLEAVIRHHDAEKLGLVDQKVFLEVGSDCLYYDEAKLSWNWFVVMHRPVKKKKEGKQKPLNEKGKYREGIR